MAEKEYVDRVALIKEITESTESTWGNGLDRSWWSHSVQLKENMVRCINNHTVANVVEVVRCKNCAYWKEHNGMAEGMECCVLFDYCFRPLLTGPEDFCSRGKRKDDDHEASDGH